ncbi:GIY-YIG nuclease family protein [Polaromonas jejuensis]|uniref:GIY-YIG nuclease family protein n=1 Tax=Polaromonas jejuensis TaxID=457502 RepID=A0ABW0QE95_9BURK|nr:GIY-YIG nuclease family protein [Polaromonas jejuensis]
MTQTKSLFHSQRPLHKKLVRQIHQCEPSQPMGVWLPRRPGHPASGGVNRQAPNQPSYVYLFVHATENRFKIGKSQSPIDRLAQLPEAEQIDGTQSLRVALPDRLRAGQVESLLHKGLAGYRLQLSWMSASGMFRAWPQPWDGATEWFSLAGLRHAIELLRAVPGLNDAEGVLLQTLDGQPYWLDRRDAHLSLQEQRRHDAGRYNLGRIDHVCDVLMLIKRHLDLCWKESNDQKASAGILRIKGFKPWWTMEHLAPRLALTSHELWALKTGKLPSKPDRAMQAFTPLVRLIRYAGDEPNDLELVFNAMERIRRLPAGAVITRRWAAFREVITS